MPRLYKTRAKRTTLFSLKGFAFLGLFSGISGNAGNAGISGKSPIIPSVPIVPFINLRALRTTLFTFQFSLYQSRAKRTTLFTFHLSVFSLYVLILRSLKPIEKSDKRGITIGKSELLAKARASNIDTSRALMRNLSDLLGR